MIAPLTARWAALVNPQAWTMTFLVSRKDGWSGDDYLGEAMSGWEDYPGCEVLSGSATKGTLCSIRIRFIAPDEQTAQTVAQGVVRSCGRNAQFVDALKIAPSRLMAQERAGR